MSEPEKDPGGISGFLVRKLIKDYRNIEQEDTRAKYGYLGGWVSVIINLILAGIKFSLGYMINSKALIADAMHSVSDLMTSAVVIFGFMFAKKPRDKQHPFGHANAELIASLIMSVLLIISGVELLRSNVSDLITWEFKILEVDWLTITLILLTILAKEWLFHFSSILAKLIQSKALDADAWHHRLDSLTTLLVLISIIAASQGVIWLDSAVGVLVALVVIWSGIEFAIDSISPLLGESASPEILQKISSLVLEDAGISNVHDIIVHQYGRSHFVSLHVEISIRLSPIQMHDIAMEASERVMKVFKGACTVHVDPIDSESGRYQEVAGVLQQLVGVKRELLDFHDLHFRWKKDQEIIRWEFSVDPDIEESTYPELKKELNFYLQNLMKESSLQFSLEPGFNIVPQ